MIGPTPSADEAVRLLAARYSAEADAYARLWSPVLRPLAQPLLRALPLAGAARVLDVATGTGGLLADVRAAAPGAAVIGVDRAAGMLRVARATSDSPLAVMDAQRLGLRPASVDVAILAFALFHLPDPVRGLAEVARVLRPGGTIGIATWGDDPPCPAMAAWDEELDDHGAQADPEPSLARHEAMNTPGRLRALLTRAGLAPVRVWRARCERRWAREELFALRAGFGARRRRLATIDADRRAACLAAIRERLAALDADAFVYRPEIVFALARRKPCPSG